MFGGQRRDHCSYNFECEISSRWKKQPLCAYVIWPVFPYFLADAGASAKRDYRKFEMLGNSIQNWRFKRGQFLLLGPVLLSPHKMKLMLIAILAAFVVSLQGQFQYGSNAQYGHSPVGICDCDYSSGGCRVRKILQSISCEGKRKKLTFFGKSPKYVSPLHFELKKWILAKKRLA